MKRAPANAESSASSGKKARAASSDEEEEDDSSNDGVPDRPDVLPDGLPVLVLAGDKRGQKGSVCGFERDEAYDGCYGIDLWAGGRPTFVDRRSLLPRYGVTLIGLQSRADLNKKCATIEGFDHERDRYEVELADDQKSRIKITTNNILLPTGARVRAHGLVSAAHHNGKLGQVVGYIEESGRYDVQLVDGSSGQTTVRLKRENVRL